MADILRASTTWSVDPASTTTQQFLRGLRIAICVIAVTVLSGSGMFRNLSRYTTIWPQITAYTVFVAVVVIEIVLIRKHRGWSKLRWFGLAAAFAASSWSILTLPSGTAVSAADWAYGTVGWIFLLLVLELRAAWLIGLLALHEAMTVLGVALSGPVDLDVWLNLAAGSLGALGYPFAAGIAATALRAVAAAADAAAKEAADIRTAEEVAARLHEHREFRFADVYERAVPILQGLADASLDPDDPRVQRTCAIEAARMRRLFAETDVVPDALLHELRHGAEVADRRGVLVELETRGSWVDPPVAVRRAITEAPLAALTTAQSASRVTVTGVAGVLTVSVVSDCGRIDLPASGGAGVVLDSVLDGDMMWVEAQWTMTAS